MLKPNKIELKLLQQRKIYAYEGQGSRHDTGNKLGYLKAVVYFALRRKDIVPPPTLPMLFVSSLQSSLWSRWTSPEGTLPEMSLTNSR